MCLKPTINNYQVVGEASGAPETFGHGPCPRLVQTNKHNGIVQGTKRRICANTFAFPWLIGRSEKYKSQNFEKVGLKRTYGMYKFRLKRTYHMYKFRLKRTYGMYKFWLKRTYPTL